MGSLSSLQFYVVISDKAVRESIKFLLESYDADVQSYANGRSFLMNTHAMKPGYVLIEDEISDVNTKDLLKTIKAKIKNNHILLFVNPSYSHYSSHSFKQNGIAAVLHKPIDSVKLLQTIITLQ